MALDLVLDLVLDVVLELVLELVLEPGRTGPQIDLKNLISKIYRF